MVKELVCKYYSAKYSALEMNQTFLIVLKMMLDHNPPAHMFRMLVLLAHHVREWF